MFRKEVHNTTAWKPRVADKGLLMTGTGSHITLTDFYCSLLKPEVQFTTRYPTPRILAVNIYCIELATTQHWSPHSEHMVLHQLLLCLSGQRQLNTSATLRRSYRPRETDYSVVIAQSV
jgi:hypothetical protein